MAEKIKGLTKTQNNLVSKLREGWIIREDRENRSAGKIEYWLAQISSHNRDCYHFPKRINKRTVWALIRGNLLCEIRPWWNSPTRVYVLREMKNYFIDRAQADDGK